MKKCLLLSVILSVSVALSATDYVQKTDLLHQEVAAHTNPNITEKTHPILWAMIKELAHKAHIDAPRYVTLYEGEYTFVDDHGGVHKGMQKLGANASFIGDLYISRKILLVASYQTIEGIVAVAIAEKALKKALKTPFFGLGVAAVVGMLSGAGETTTTRIETEFFKTSRTEFKLAPVALTVFSGLLAANAYGNKLRKDADLLAARLTDAENVINGIKEAESIDETYTKHDLVNRFIDACGLRGVCNTVFYPIRSYTTAERIAYLEKTQARYAA